MTDVSREHLEEIKARIADAENPAEIYEEHAYCMNWRDAKVLLAEVERQREEIERIRVEANEEIARQDCKVEARNHEIARLKDSLRMAKSRSFARLRPAFGNLRREAIIRAGLRCEECGVEIAFMIAGKLAVLAGTQVDHVRYTRFGGKELPEDLRALCGGAQGCHARKHGTEYWRGRHR